MFQGPAGVASYRTSNVSFFLDCGVSRDDGRYLGTRAGLVTYDENDDYKVSYLEVGFRSDHICEPLVDRFGHTKVLPANAAQPREYDSRLVIARTADSTESAE